MTILEFLASIVDSLAWPALILLVLLIFRKPLLFLVRNLIRVRFKDIEFEFAQVDEDSKSYAQPVEREQKELDDRLGFITKLAPRKAILEAWQAVETAAVKALKSKNIENFKFYRGPMRGEYLVQAELLNKEQQMVFDRLHSLRNRVEYIADEDIPRKAADNYISAAYKWVAYFERRAKTP